MHAAIALGNLGPEAKAAVPALVERLRKDDVDGVRANCAVALGRIHSEPQLAVPALVESFLKEKLNDVRGVALMALLPFGPLGAKTAIPALEALAKDPENKNLPDFQKKADALREMLAKRLKAK